VKIQLWSIGKEHDPYIRDGMAVFQKRLQHYVDFEVKLIPTVKQAASLSVPELKKQEAKIILDLLQPTDFLLALDEKGKMITRALDMKVIRPMPVACDDKPMGVVISTTFLVARPLNGKIYLKFDDKNTVALEQQER